MGGVGAKGEREKVISFTLNFFKLQRIFFKRLSSQVILGFVKLTLDINQSRGFEEGWQAQVPMLPYSME